MDKQIKVIGAIVVSTVVLTSALFVILSDAYPDSYTKWAFGTVGVVVGYWLR